MEFEYRKICLELLKNLTQREKEIIIRRFGLNLDEKETLEAIGQDFKITRERIRQIQNNILNKIRPKLDSCETIFQSFLDYLNRFGRLRKEEVLLSDLGGRKWENEIYFLLSLRDPFQRWPGDEGFHSLWFVDQNSLLLAKKVINFLYEVFQERGKPLSVDEIFSLSSIKPEFLTSYLEISKKIYRNEDGLYGLRNWPEINPRGIKDKAYLVLKKTRKPLHFSQVANLIEGSHIETVHNELIKDKRFVLVGRGIYALAEWGYTPGQLKDIIFSILKRAERAMSKEEILKEVLEQRLVKKNSILMNLSNKKYFLRDPQGNYKINPDIA